MCSSRRDEPSGSTNVQGREVLPTNVKPVHYDLTLEPDFKTFKYNGTVTIELASPRDGWCFGVDADTYMQPPGQ
jgi:aminopeptidase 2